MIDNISGVRLFRLTAQLDGSIGLLLEQKYAATLYLLDLSQAEKLGKDLIEMTIGLRDTASLPNRPTED